MIPPRPTSRILQAAALLCLLATAAASTPAVERSPVRIAETLWTLTPSELLTPDGRPNQKASGEPYRWTYTLRGGSEEAWEPRFTYYGFRYVQVEGAVPAGSDGPADLPRVVSIEMAHTRNSAPETGRFETSLPLFNRIDGLVRWAIRSNLASVLTDCPHREKLGWLEQTYLMGDSVHFDHDLFGLYRKQVADVVDAQAEDGLVPDIAPEYVEFEGGFRDSPEWGGAGVIVPWLAYRWYGDRDTLERAWPAMKRYVDYLGTKAEGQILSHGLGDWYDLGPRFPGEAQLTPKAVTATATWFRCLRVAAGAARVLGHPGDAARYEALAQDVRTAFNRAFFDPSTATWSTASQTALAMPLVVGLAPDGEEGRVLESLVQRIEKDGRALTAGDIGFHYVVEALSGAGRGDLLFAMNARDDVPGYGFQLKKGATALTESWAALEEVSNNHLMLGHLVRWFYSGLLGIDQAGDSVGYASLVLKPQVVAGLEWARGEYRSPRGRIASSWRKEPGRFVLEVEVPVNATAEVHLPAAASALILESERALEGREDVGVISRTEGGAVVALGSGRYVFEVARPGPPGENELRRGQRLLDVGDGDHHGHRVERGLLEPGALVEPFGVGSPRLQKHRADSGPLRHLQGSQQGIAQEPRAEPDSLVASVDRKPADDHHRDRVGHLPSRLPGGSRAGDRARRERVVAHHAAFGADDVGAGGAARLVAQCPEAKPVVELGRAAVERGRIVMRFDVLRSGHAWRCTHRSHGACARSRRRSRGFSVGTASRAAANRR
jgi:hypothetical protein